MKNKWVDRTFNFEFGYSIYPEFIERLMATPIIIETILTPIPADFLRFKQNDEWSIQENVGHLITVDDLFSARVDDYESGAESLRAADVSGARTDKANYNADQIDSILETFRDKRMAYIERLEKLDVDLFQKSAWHPRLETQMRLCDMLYFQAEHDDHHVTKIKHLSQRYF